MHWRKRVRPFAVALTLPFYMLACSDDAPMALDPVPTGGPTLAAATEAQLSDLLDTVNGNLEAAGSNLRVGMVETLTILEGEEQGITVLWNDVGNKQLGFDFVPGDPRRLLGSPEGGWSADPNSITYAIDEGDGATANGLTAAETSPEIRDAMQTWDDVSCSNLNITEVPAPFDLGFVAASIGAGGSFDIAADIQHAGWLEVEFGATTIAATFTIIWIDDDGNLTDLDGNGVPDAAMREIYYDAFCQGCPVPGIWIWTVDDDVNGPGLDIDIESVALHEAGHGLSQGHFGMGFITNTDGKLHLAPEAVMQAAYVDPQRDLKGSDDGGHCSNWGSWPTS
ncbi:MAG TPA: hypothetical protein VFP76_00720 [Gemmatimonadota bacterium]|nr:hypothetical protein [Gemmatimonadota bacterium]